MTRARFSTEARMDQVAAVLTPTGITMAEIADALGIQGNSWISVVMSRAVKAGVAFRGQARVSDGIKSPEVVFFPSAESRDSFMSAYLERQKEKRQAYWRDKAFRRKGRDRSAEIAKRSAKRAEAAEQREANAIARALERRRIAIAEREQRNLRARLEREAKAAAKQREKAQAKKTKTRLKALTKAAGALVFKKGTETAAAKPKGPAFIAGELDMSRAKITRGPDLPDRWAVSKVVPVVSSSECRPWAEAVAA